MVTAVVFWTVGNGFYRDLSAKSEEAYEELKVFSDVIELIEREYVDEVDTKELIQKAIQGMVHSLTITDWQLNGIMEHTIRAAMGNAAKLSGWFKDLNNGEGLADLVAATLPEIIETPLGIKLQALEDRLYAG